MSLFDPKFYTACNLCNVNILEVRHPNSNEVVDLFSISKLEEQGNYIQVTGISLFDFKSDVNSQTLNSNLLAYMQSSTMSVVKISKNYLFRQYYSSI